MSFLKTNSQQDESGIDENEVTVILDNLSLTSNCPLSPAVPTQKDSDLVAKFPDLQLRWMNPNCINFSQISINNKKVPSIDDWSRWDCSKYGLNGNFVLVVDFGEGKFVAFDNSRVEIARNERKHNPEFEFLCDVRLAADNPLEVSFYSEIIERFEVQLSFHVPNPEYMTKGIYVATMRPKSFSMLVNFRCAQQGENFPLTGHIDVPARDQRRTSDGKLNGPSLVTQPSPTEEEIFDQLHLCLRNASTIFNKIYLSANRGGQMHHNVFFDSFLLAMTKEELRQHLVSSSCSHFSERWIKANGEFDERDKFVVDQAFEIDIAAEEEREIVWLEYLEDNFCDKNILVKDPAVACEKGHHYNLSNDLATYEAVERAYLNRLNVARYRIVPWQSIIVLVDYLVDSIELTGSVDVILPDSTVCRSDATYESLEIQLNNEQCEETGSIELGLELCTISTTTLEGLPSASSTFVPTFVISTSFVASSDPNPTISSPVFISVPAGKSDVPQFLSCAQVCTARVLSNGCWRQCKNRSKRISNGVVVT